MSETFIGAIKAWCPKASLILDRFHIVKALNEAVDEVRKMEWRKADKAGRKALKGLRWLLYKHSRKHKHHLEHLIEQALPHSKVRSGYGPANRGKINDGR